MRQFAYVDEDAQIRLRDLDLDTEASPPLEPSSDGQRVCAWPTWAPDGSRLAYVRYEVEGGRARATTIQVTNPDGSHRAEAYRAQGVPIIYFNWAPSGERLAVLVQEEESLALRVVDSAGGGQGAMVAQGAPLYFAWHPDSAGLVAHIGGGDVLGAVHPRLMWIRLDAPRVDSHLTDGPAPGFRAPAWAPSLQGATVAVAKEGAQVVGLAQGLEEPVEALFPCGIAPAFVWSPGGEALACTYRQTADGPYDGIWVYRVGPQTLDRISDVSPLAFFWCDDRRLVCATGPVGDRRVGLRIVDAAGKADEEDYGYVRPSRDGLIMFGHFDQYAGSARVCSPAGDELLLAASRAQELENGSVPTVRQVLVRPLSPGEPDRLVGRGRLAFWRPDPGR